MNKKSKEMNKKILDAMWVSNIITILIVLAPFVSPQNYDKIVGVLFLSTLGQIIFGILGTLAFILWIYCLITHGKRSKNGFYVLLLIFLSVLYVPFYYYHFFIKHKA